jgi:lipopolysaccharide/colanic/teichoic acid biosynthesis glycosyltransferase
MIRLDIAYCQNISLLGDIWIILRTPVVIAKMVIDSLIEKNKGKIEALRVLKV